MKKILLLLLVAVFILPTAACSNSENTANTGSKAATESPSESPFDIAAYKELVSKCNDSIMTESLLLSNMGQYEYNYWKASSSISGTIDYDDMISKAQEWLCEKSEITDGTLESNYNSICDQYKTILETNISGSEAEEIEKDFSELFNSFNSLYLLVTAPSGGISSFADNFNEYSNNITNYNSTLSILVSD